MPKAPNTHKSFEINQLLFHNLQCTCPQAMSDQSTCGESSQLSDVHHAVLKVLDARPCCDPLTVHELHSLVKNELNTPVGLDVVSSALCHGDVDKHVGTIEVEADCVRCTWDHNQMPTVEAVVQAAKPPISRILKRRSGGPSGLRRPKRLKGLHKPSAISDRYERLLTPQKKPKSDVEKARAENTKLKREIDGLKQSDLHDIAEDLKASTKALADKWTSVCQEVATEMAKRLEEQESLTRGQAFEQLFSIFSIEPDLLRYDKEEEEFV